MRRVRHAIGKCDSAAHRRSLGFLLLLLFVAARNPSRASAETIATDRPGNGTSPGTVPARQLQIEASANYAHDKGITSLSAPTLLRWAAVDSLELRAGTSIATGRFLRGVDAELEIADMLVGAKVALLAQNGNVPNVAMVAEVTLPTGGDTTSAGATVPEVRALASWAIHGGFSVLVNLGGDVPQDASGRYAQLIYVANVGYAVNSHVGVFAEGFGKIDVSGDRKSIVQLDAGMTLLLSDRLQLDCFTQHGLSDAAQGFQLALGLSHLW